MKDLRIPGIVWAIVLVAIVAVIHENADAWHIAPIYSDLAVVVVVGVLKGMNLGVDQLNQALDIIDNIKSQGTVARTRGTSITPGGMAESEPLITDTITANAPPRPNKLARFLVG